MLNVAHVSKTYSSVVAVDDVSLTAERGQIIGLLGPNGAGKTTTIRMILNIITPDKGSISFDGGAFGEATRNIVGYLPEERGLYRKSRVLNTILYFARLKGIDLKEGKRRAYEWLKRFDLLTAYDRRVDELSKGNQQKVQFIIAVIHDPELVILDEPFSGLDPVNQIILKNILMELKERGKAVVFSTHQMEQAEKLCERMVLINKGKVVLEGAIPDVKSRYGKNTLQIEFSGDASFLRGMSWVKSAQIYENYAEVVLNGHEPLPSVLRELAGRLDMSKFEVTAPSLNAIFLEAVGAGAGAGESAP